MLPAMLARCCSWGILMFEVCGPCIVGDMVWSRRFCGLDWLYIWLCVCVSFLFPSILFSIYFRWYVNSLCLCRVRFMDQFVCTKIKTLQLRPRIDSYRWMNVLFMLSHRTKTIKLTIGKHAMFGCTIHWLHWLVFHLVFYRISINPSIPYDLYCLFTIGNFHLIFFSFDTGLLVWLRIKYEILMNK